MAWFERLNPEELSMKNNNGMYNVYSITIANYLIANKLQCYAEIQKHWKTGEPRLCYCFSKAEVYSDGLLDYIKNNRVLDFDTCSMTQKEANIIRIEIGKEVC